MGAYAARQYASHLDGFRGSSVSEAAPRESSPIHPSGRSGDFSLGRSALSSTVVEEINRHLTDQVVVSQAAEQLIHAHHP